MLKRLWGVVFDSLFIFIVTIITLFIGNYTIGIGDQIIHLPYIKSLLDPNMYPGDSLIHVLKSKPTFFWELFVWLFKWLGIERGIFALQVISLVIFLYATKIFTFKVTSSRLASYIAPLLFIFPKYSFGYSSLFVVSNFIPRNFTIALILIALVLFLQNEGLISYLLLGLIANLHIISVLPIMLGLLAHTLLSEYSFKRVLIKAVIAILIFTAGMLPLLIKYWHFTDNGVEPIGLKSEYVDYYNSVLTPFYVVENYDSLLLILNSVLIVVLCFTWLLKTTTLTKNMKRFLLILLCTSTSLVLFSIIIEEYSQEPILLQLQMGRSGAYSLLIFTSLLSYFIARLIINVRSITAFLIMVFASIIATIVAPAFLIEVSARLKTNKLYKLLYVALIIYLVIALNYSTFKYLRSLKPSINTNTLINDNVSAQLWLKQNSDKTAKVLAPYYIGGFTEPDFRTISERTNILTNADIVETILNTDMLIETKEKLNVLTLGNYTYLMQGDNLFNYHIGRELYHKAVSTNLGFIKSYYKLDYVIIEADYDLTNMQPIYQNNSYKIYMIG